MQAMENVRNATFHFSPMRREYNATYQASQALIIPIRRKGRPTALTFPSFYWNCFVDWVPEIRDHVLRSDEARLADVIVLPNTHHLWSMHNEGSARGFQIEDILAVFHRVGAAATWNEVTLALEPGFHGVQNWDAIFVRLMQSLPNKHWTFLFPTELADLAFRAAEEDTEEVVPIEFLAEWYATHIEGMLT